MIINEQNYLAHFGVRGMHWGIRKNYDTNPVQNKSAEIKNSKSRQKLTTKQKQAIGIGISAAVIVGGLVAARALHVKIDSGEFRAGVEKGKSLLLTGKKFQLKRNLDLAKKGLSAEEIDKLVLAQINPNYGSLGTKGNCRRAAYAFELRRRGYDVVATSTKKGTGQGIYGMMNVLSPGKRIRGDNILDALSISKKNNPLYASLKTISGGAAKKISVTPRDPGNVKSIWKELYRQPNGARGELVLKWIPGGGHSMSYEIIDDWPVIFDAQTGRKYLTMAELDKDIGRHIAEAAYTRLDNVDLNIDFLTRWVKNA